MDPGYLLIAIAVLILLVLILFILSIVQSSRIKRLNYRISALCLAKDGQSLEDEINQIIEENKYLMNASEEQRSQIRLLFRRMEKNYQKMGLVKYDAFNQMGGKLSFALALLDEKNNGFLMNSVHSADGCYAYTKEIIEGQSEIELGREEEKALNIALEKDTTEKRKRQQ